MKNISNTIRELLNAAISNEGKWQSGELNDELCVNFRCINELWAADLVFKTNSESRVEFTAVLNKQEIEIESLRVSEAIQRRGVGSKLFSGMLDIIRVMNDVLQGENRPLLLTLFGDLKPYDPPYDEYEKSIPFYIRQAEIHNLEISFFEDDTHTFERKYIEPEEALGFIDTMRCGGFTYKL